MWKKYSNLTVLKYLLYSQPFVENAIIHGLMDKKTNGTIDVTIKKLNEEQLFCIITDNGIGLSKARELKEKKKEPV